MFQVREDKVSFPFTLLQNMYLFGTRFFKLILVEAIPDIVSLSYRFGVFFAFDANSYPFLFLNGMQNHVFYKLCYHKLSVHLVKCISVSMHFHFNVQFVKKVHTSSKSDEKRVEKFKNYVRNFSLNTDKKLLKSI